MIAASGGREFEQATIPLQGQPMSGSLLQIRNHHSVACGDPPIINSDDRNVYLGYFENAFGEQWVFSFDRATGKAELRGGDIGWNTVHEVCDGEVGELMLGREEAAWLQACWRVATAGHRT